MKRKLISYFLLLTSVFVSLLLFSACNDAGKEGGDTTVTDNKVTIKLNGDTATTSDASSAKVEGAVITILKEGEYTVSGKLTNGQIIVELAEKKKVKMILNGADITCATSAPLYVKGCKHLTLELAEGTVNSLTDGATYTYGSALETEPSAALFSKDDLKISGTGSLNVTANFNNGIASKDTLTIESGNITVTAANNGIKGKDSVTILGGNITVNAKGDAIKSDQDKDLSLGYVEISGGTVKLTAEDEGIQAYTNVKISGGTVTIDSEGNGIKAETAVEIKTGASVTITSEGDGITATSVTGSAKVNGSDVTY